MGESASFTRIDHFCPSHCPDIALRALDETGFYLNQTMGKEMVISLATLIVRMFARHLMSAF